MYAVVKTGGKQYRVEKNDVVLVEKLNANDGDQVVLGDVLMLGEGKNVTVGNPLVNDAAVMAQVVRQTRGPKITMIYKRRRKNSRRKQGHKQDLTLLKIVDIAETGGLKLTPKKAVAKPIVSKAKAVEAKSKTSGTKTKVEKKAESTTTKTKVETKAKSTTAKAKVDTKTKSTATKSKVENKTKADPKPKKSTTKDK
ncbi:50S ribosomal protein L21 [Alphaproteobacteria bacterium]|nr:50S ribosomal protein L21 [Alphaproteobacteria bacterium]